MLKNHKRSGGFWLLLRLALLFLFWTQGQPVKCADGTSNSVSASMPDFVQPKMFRGTVYARDSGQTDALFTFQRSATPSGSSVSVELKYNLPDGSNAAVEFITYESGRLVSYDMKELQAGLWGAIQIKPDPKNPAVQKISITYGHDGKEKSKTEDLEKDTLIDDMVYPFILSHWDDLMRGDTVKCRLVSLEHTTTFGFKLSKAAEAVFNGNPAVVIRMEPVSLIVAGFVNPIYFTMEINAPHRIWEYVGRTTPRFKTGKSWRYLDAETVFDWK